MTQNLTELFEKAVVASKALTERPSNEDLLSLYAHFKQAKEGDNVERKPAMFDFKAIAKHQAWEKLKGMSKEDAMLNYIELVKKLQD
ncbi:acyl-CoA-binding protein [Persicobacter sp. CCB-QB2]|uniref:acyl-CoA-binding protein n=1 Tax=Persicobacter sp. CCB-QB2 TaxID=1561025 RepID=UPI0006A9976E|nr:acyl-CoA-binding protein [Persicobacter sp. CCB-QB2]